MNLATIQPKQHSQSLLSPLWMVRKEPLFASVARLTEIDLNAYYDRQSETEEKPYEVVEGTAVIPITGYLTRDHTWWNYYFGGTSSVKSRTLLMQAAADPDVQSILLYVYSPGGEVYGIADLAGSVVEAKKQKKVWAYIADEGCSAAYWVASQADRIICNPTAIVGSIGILCVVEDWSKAYQKAGVKVEVFKSGEHKGAGTEGTSLTEEQRAEKQRLVDTMADQFFEAVQRGRNLSDDEMDAVTTGQVWIGEEAKELRLVDEINTLEGAVAKLQPKTPASNDVRRMCGANTQPALTGKKEKPMFRELLAKLAASFAKLGRNHLAAAALGADENNADDLVQRLNAQIEAEVQTAVAANPMLAALNAAEIKTPDALQSVLNEAKEGREYSAQVMTDLEAAAIRRFGNTPEAKEGAKSYITAYQHLPIAERKKVIEAWNADADKMFGTSKTERAERQTVPTRLQIEARDADDKSSLFSEGERSRIRETAQQTAKNGGTH